MHPTNTTRRIRRARRSAAAFVALTLLAACSRDDDAADSTPVPSATAIVVATTDVSVPPSVTEVASVPPGSAPAPSTVSPAGTEVVADVSDTSVVVGSSVPGSSVPSDGASDGKVTYIVEAGVNQLEVQESPEQTTFVVSDPEQNVVYFEIFENSDPALNELFETPPGGGATDTELVLRDDAGTEVARVLLTDLAAARVAVGQTTSESAE